MTGRDRMVIMAVAALGVLVAVWFLGVSPKRQQASELAKQVSSEQAQLATAQSQVSDAQLRRPRTAPTTRRSSGSAKPSPRARKCHRSSTSWRRPRVVATSNSPRSRPERAAPPAPALRQRLCLERQLVGRGRQRRKRGLQPDAVHVRVHWQLHRPLSPVPAAQPLHPPHSVRRARGQRPPAHDSGRAAPARHQLGRPPARKALTQNSSPARSRRPRTCCRPAKASPAARRRLAPPAPPRPSPARAPRARRTLRPWPR